MPKRVSAGVAHELPADLRKVLAADPKALAAWESLTPLARNEWICWTVSVKKAETRLSGLFPIAVVETNKTAV